jgi:thiamine phosphate synthase YjbQ (UPF0047 family)
MATYHKSFEINTAHGPSFHDVTDEVQAAIAESGLKEGIVVVFSPHTTCSVIIQEDSYDMTFSGIKFLFQDLLEVFEEIVPRCQREGQYLHPGPKCVDYSVNEVREELSWTLNTDAHLRSAIMGRSEAIPVVDGAPELGEHGRIYFADFDGTRPRVRTVRVQIVGG